MDPLGYATHHLQTSARFSCINIKGYHPAGPLFLMVKKHQAWTLVKGVIRGKLGCLVAISGKNRLYHWFYHKNPYLGFFDFFFEVLNRGADLSHVDLKKPLPRVPRGQMCSRWQCVDVARLKELPVKQTIGERPNIAVWCVKLRSFEILVG